VNLERTLCASTADFEASGLALLCKADLVGISDEIKHLQEESLTMNVKLRNRRTVEAGLKGFLVRSPSNFHLTDH
jgi:hypothetical protein